MVRRRLLLVAVAFGAAALLTANASDRASASNGCTAGDFVTEACTDARTDGNAVAVGARHTVANRGSTGTKSSAPRSNDAPRPDDRVEDMSAEETSARTGWYPTPRAEYKINVPAAPAEDDEPTEPRTVTLADLKSFSPSSGKERSEPMGWTVIGLNTNFIADGSVQVRTGELLGRPAAVRFTPAAYHWDYGDGTSFTGSAPGATWKALGLNEFDKTPTSHRYLERGTYTVALTIEYTAEYQFAGSPWIPVEGTVQDSPAPMTITATTANTVLVHKNCASDPKGPGC